MPGQGGGQAGAPQEETQRAPDIFLPAVLILLALALLLQQVTGGWLYQPVVWALKRLRGGRARVRKLGARTGGAQNTSLVGAKRG